MQIEIDSHSGFCYGVLNSISLTEAQLKDGEHVFCLGEIVHNEEEVARLKTLGLEVIQHNELQNLHNARILIRAHGEPPETYHQLAKGNNQVFEGTCPIVLNLQKKVLRAFEEMNKVNGQVVIYGKKGHAEVIGLVGQTNNTALVVSSENDLNNLDYSRPIALFSQTTQSPDEYNQLITAIQQKQKEQNLASTNFLKTTDSICRHVSKRGEHLALFASRFDVVVFVSGTNSSNGKVLFQICKQHNRQSYWIPSVDKLLPEWFDTAKTVGVCGATSTPIWLMENVKEKIQNMNSY